MFFESNGLLVSQPFGEFIVTTVPAEILLGVAYSDRLRAELQNDGTYKLEGSQRKLLTPRLSSIGGYIDGANAAFPNSIILAANYRIEDGLVEEDEARRWTYEVTAGNVVKIKIPSNAKLAPIIDGQHRLFGFQFSDVAERLQMPLVCAIYFDLPRPYQAHLFATVNANQRAVSKSQTYELFGYNLEDEPPEKWNPEKLAVFLTRKLNTDTASPLKGHVTIAAQNDFSETAATARKKGTWVVSMATIVEGIVKLISKNPKSDANAMDGEVRYKAKDRDVLAKIDTGILPPLRELYVKTADDLIYAAVKNYLLAIDSVFWKKASISSFILKTVGIQAIFTVARPLMQEAFSDKKISYNWFVSKLGPATEIDFSDSFFHASGTGKQHIANCILIKIGLKDLTSADIRPDYRLHYKRILGL